MDWHADKKAPASKFYPTHARKGKKMVGKPGRDELLREKNARYLDRWCDAFEARHNRPPTEEEKYAVVMEGRVIKDYDRLRDSCKTVVLDRKMLGHEELSAWVHGERAMNEIEKRLEGDKGEREKGRVLRNRARFDLRMKCPIPMNVMRFFNDGNCSKEGVCSTFDVTDAELVAYMDAFFGVEDAAS